jgi:hypothetical protein
MANRYESVEERLWGRVAKDGDCWLFPVAEGNRYGRIMVEGRVKMAHRLAYELAVGPISEGLTIDHLCRRTACINPAHLESVTVAENILRGDGPAARNRKKTRCLRGHVYDEANTYRAADGSRKCKACRAAQPRNPVAADAAVARWRERHPEYKKRANARRRERYASDPEYRERVKRAVYEGRTGKPYVQRKRYRTEGA